MERGSSSDENSSMTDMSDDVRLYFHSSSGSPSPIPEASSDHDHDSYSTQSSFTSQSGVGTKNALVHHFGELPPAESPKRPRLSECPFSSITPTSAVPMIATTDSSVAAASPLATALAIPASPRERYEIKSVLRDSLFGKVVLASCVNTQQPVAVKLSNLKLIEMGRTWKGARVCESPIEESRIMRMVSGHPHILQLVDEQCDNNVHWMVMEYAPHGEFFDYVCKQTHLDDNAGRKYFLQMLSALAHLHSRQVCHLDFSLENMLLDEQYNIKLCDFGVARVMVPGTVFAAAVGANPKPGKLRYMAPEVLEGKPFDGRAVDVFALGVTLFCMLTGNIPFASAAVSDPGYAYICANKLPQMLDLLRLRHRVGPMACDLLTRLLQPHPLARITFPEILRHPWVNGQA